MSYPNNQPPSNQPYSPPRTFERERSFGQWFKAGFGVALGVIAASILPWIVLILVIAAVASNSSATTY